MRGGLKVAGVAFLLCSQTALPQEAELPEIQAEIDDAREACEGLGTFEFVRDQVLREVPDLNRDGVPEIAVDHRGFVCHGAYSIYGGSAGTPLVMLISTPTGRIPFRFQARAWQVYDWPHGEGRTLLVLHHGAACGGAGSAPCFAAYAWKKGRMFSIGRK